MGIEMKVDLSNRHIHPSTEDFKILFGENAQLTVKKMMGKTAFAANETVTIKGPRGVMEGIRILSPLRDKTQIELLAGDCRQLGITAPVCESGDLENAGPVTIIGPEGEVVKEHAVIIAQRHIHANYAVGEELGIKDGELVKVRVPGVRGLVFENVLIRLHGGPINVIHLDLEEGNAAGCKNGDILEVIK